MKAVRQMSFAAAAGVFSMTLFAQTPHAGQSAVPGDGHTFSAAQLAEIDERDQLSRAIIDNVSADAAARGDGQWQIRLLSMLYGTRSRDLHDIALQAHTLDQAHAMAGAAFTAARSPSLAGAKALTDVGDDLVFTPKTPCRFIDTRNVGGPIASGLGGARNFDTFLLGSSYGGDSACTLPGHGEIAIAANVTVTVASGSAGFLTLRPYGSSALTSFINWPAGGTPGLANAGIITTALDASSHYEFQAVAGGNTPNLIVDYFGYFAPAAPTALDCVNTTMTAVAISPGGSGVGGAPVTCPSGYTFVSIFCDASFTGLVVDGFASYNSGNGQFCNFRNDTAASINAHIGARCCRVP